MRYCILERTPFPGYWQPTHGCFLQEAEYALWHGTMSHYYERAVIIGKRSVKQREVVLYTYADAQAIIDYLKKSSTRHGFFEYRVWGMVTPPDAQ